MSFEPREYLQHIRAETAFLIGQSRELTRAQFEQDEMLQRAFVRSLEVIGEASKKISPAFRADYPAIEWRAMAGMRDHLIHGYFAVDYALVWDIVRTKVPELHERISEILAAEQ